MLKKIGKYSISRQRSTLKVPVLDSGEVDLGGVLYSPYLVDLVGFTNLHDVMYCRLFVQHSFTGQDYDFTLQEIRPKIVESGTLYTHLPEEEKFIFEKGKTILKVEYEMVQPKYVIINYRQVLKK